MNLPCQWVMTLWMRIAYLGGQWRYLVGEIVLPCLKTSSQDETGPWNFRVNLHFLFCKMGVALGLETPVGAL